MRGKLRRFLRDAVFRRITPAGAGKTNREEQDGHIKTDHPRRCGENSSPQSKTQSSAGSPPQVRGKRSDSNAVYGASRITPAGAGKTGRCFPEQDSDEDHPRRCGENQQYLHVFRILKGSPPQVRGKLHLPQAFRLRHRITPAGAGKTYIALSALCTTQDHPRRCGENHQNHTFYLLSLGSPPQVRGKLMPACINCGIARITPAGAGKTQCAD